MLTNWLILDVASAALPEADVYLEDTVRAPAHYKDADKIAAYIAEKQAERLASAATDIDLARITGLGWMESPYAPEPEVVTCKSVDDEAAELVDLSDLTCAIITFGGFAFDLPLLMRRARYLGVPFPTINLDRYKSPHVDLCELLSDRNPQRRRSLDFYVRRMGWDDLMPKPLSGAEEAQVPVTGRWDELVKSVERDVEATYRLAKWAGVIA